MLKIQSFNTNYPINRQKYNKNIAFCGEKTKNIEYFEYGSQKVVNTQYKRDKVQNVNKLMFLSTLMFGIGCLGMGIGLGKRPR